MDKKKDHFHILENISIGQNCTPGEIDDSFKAPYCAFLVDSQFTAYKNLLFHSQVQRFIILFGCYPQVQMDLMESLRNSNL